MERKISSHGSYRVGDLLRISMEVADAEVMATTEHSVILRWPWFVPDPENPVIRSGDVRLPRTDDEASWLDIPWRTEPDTPFLSVGDVCMVGIPSTVVRILSIVHFDPPVSFGRLPRREYVLDVVPLEWEGNDEAGYAIELDAAEPIRIERIEP
ncbi:hypothetical protein [Stackebrandtia albiflava]|uniref:hypothetical protein n=1 Tax=Stackebrandtia albiflava TaxID=406432 RepID=UPI0011BE9DA0|nr:hypothetical protein [Stackebrandtia albiflava]